MLLDLFITEEDSVTTDAASESFDGSAALLECGMEAVSAASASAIVVSPSLPERLEVVDSLLSFFLFHIPAVAGEPTGDSFGVLG